MSEEWCKHCGAKYQPAEGMKECKYCSADLKTGKNIKARTKNYEKGSWESVVVPRIYLITEISIILVFNYVVSYALGFVIKPGDPAVDPNYIYLMWLKSVLSVVIGTIIGLFVVYGLFGGKETTPNPKGKSPIVEVFSIFKIKKSNVKYQVLYGVLLLFLVFIPIDLISYSIPGVMEFSLNGLLSNTGNVNIYLTYSQFSVFIGFAIFVHIMVAIREELFFRGVSINRGKRYISEESTIISISLFFGFSHFAYIFSDPTGNFLYAFIWGLTAFIVGSAAGLLLLKKRFIWSLIIAHSVNNIISSSALWLYSTNNTPFSEIVSTLYLPLLIISIILGFIFRSNAVSGLKNWGKMFPSYLKKSGDSISSKLFTIGFDIILCLALFISSTFLFV